MLAPTSSNALFIVVCPMIQEMVGLPGSLYFTWMGPVNNSLILDARKTFLETFVFFSWYTCLIEIWHMMKLVEWHHEEAHLSGLD